MNQFLLVLMIVIASCVPKAPTKRMNVSRPSTIVTKKLGGDFVLSRYLNKEVKDWSLFATNGRVRVLYFGFTHCPDICPTSLTKLANKLKLLDDKDITQVQPIFVSVDYKRDTPSQVKEYVDYFSKSNIGLTGTKDQIIDVTKQYGIYFKLVPQKDSAMEYSIDHTSRFIIIDRKGEFYNSYLELDDKFLSDLKLVIGMK